MKNVFALFLICLIFFAACKKDKTTPAEKPKNSTTDTTKQEFADTAFRISNISAFTYRVDVYLSYSDYIIQKNAAGSLDLEPGKSFTYYKSNLGNRKLYIDCYTADYLHSNWQLSDSSKITINNGKDTLFLLDFEESAARNALLKDNGTNSEWKSINAYKIVNGKYISVWDTMKTYKYNLSFYKNYVGSLYVFETPASTNYSGIVSLHFDVHNTGNGRFLIYYRTISIWGHNQIFSERDSIYSHWSPTAWSNTAATPDTMMMTRFGIHYIFVRE